MYEKDKANLLALLDSAEKIIVYTEKTVNPDDFVNNTLVFDAVLMNFIVIGETVNKLSIDLKSKYNFIEWTKITDFRNIVAHDYFGVDAEEVWQIIKTDIPHFVTSLKIILEENIH